jgi:hypothetical protein
MRWGLSFFAGLSALVVGGVFLVYQGIANRADNDEFFGRRDLIGIAISSSESSAPASLTFGYPFSVRVKDDASLDFSLDGTNLPSGTYKAVLGGNRDVEVRSMQPCPGASLPNSAMTTAASCGEIRESERRLRFRWLIRSAQPGQALLVLHLPDQIIPTHGGVARWRAHLERQGKIVKRPPKRVRPSDPSGFFRDEYDPEREPVVLSPGDSRFYFENSEVDLSARQLTLRIDFETTLGVASSTYEVLTVAAALLSGLLGGGWIWHLISWLNARRARTQTTTA